MKKAFGILVSVLVCELAGIIGSIFTTPSILGAVIVIVFLWGMIMASIWFFSRISKAAAYLLIPYILWVSFAMALNISLYVLNR